MNRGSRLRILLGASIVGIIGVVTNTTWLLVAAVLLIIFSCFQYKATPPTNYTAKFGPPDGEGRGTMEISHGKGFGAMLAQEGLSPSEEEADPSTSEED